MIRFVSRLAPTYGGRSRAGGFNIVIPFWPSHRRGYDIACDEFHTGWFLYCVSLSVHTHAKLAPSFHVNFGWVRAGKGPTSYRYTAGGDIEYRQTDGTWPSEAQRREP